MRPLAIAIALGLVAGEARAQPVVSPTLVGELDLRARSADAEAEDGFALVRFRPGLRIDATPWARFVGSVEWIREKPSIVDAYGRLRWRWLTVSAGFGKTPLFPTAHDEPIQSLAIPELAPVVDALWPGRDLGLEVAVASPLCLPIEAWLRVGDGSGSALGNDNDALAFDARLDLVLGRGARQDRMLGLRAGAGGHVEEAFDRQGANGTTVDGFAYYRGPTVSGTRTVAEAHLVGWAGPARLTVEAGIAREDRSRDTDGNPETPRESQEPVVSRGITAEAVWVIRGTARLPGRRPRGPEGPGWTGGAVEVAARVDRLELGRDTEEIENGGATGGALAARWWITDWAGVALAAYVLRYDVAPIEEPEERTSVVALVRATLDWPGE